LIAAMVLTNISSNLYKNIVKLGEGREIQYRKIVVQSLYNAFEIVDLTSLSPGETKSYSFTFQTNEQVTPLTFPATAVFIEQVDSNYFVKLYTREPSKEDMYGIIAQYLK
jgi:hypothetical protein